MKNSLLPITSIEAVQADDLARKSLRTWFRVKGRQTNPEFYESFVGIYHFADILS
jgi:hypothetical protein